MRSRAGALGIMQLTPVVLEDCGLAKRFYFHRLAQIDCALYVLEQNHRVLSEPFAETFGHLPGEPVLFQPVPVGFLDRAAVCAGRTGRHGAARGCAVVEPAGRVGALFARWRIALLVLAEDFEVGELLVALIAQEQRLLAIGDHDPAIVLEPDFMFGHGCLRLRVITNRHGAGRFHALAYWQRR